MVFKWVTWLIVCIVLALLLFAGVFYLVLQRGIST